MASQVSDAVDVTSSLDAENSAFGAHSDANEASGEEKYRSLIAKEIQELKNSKAGQAKKIVFLEEKLLDHITRRPMIGPCALL
ncbi:hypothetical protein SDJN03_09504, partial [Cucurbita argyrosperma subsp. sororia]